jgi:Holliday junction resolvase
LITQLEEAGWICGSRRHIPGAGDILAAHSDYRPLLIEVKTTSDGPYKNFGPLDRYALRQAARVAGADAMLAWRPPRTKVFRYIPSTEWPRDSRADRKKSTPRPADPGAG